MTGGMMCMLCLLLGASFAASCKERPTALAGADPERGKAAVLRYGCIACHAMPGSANQGSNVGPPLHKIARRAYLGGVVPNTPDGMVRWLRNPPAFNPRTAMPNLGVSEEEARDIASYLYTFE